MTNAERLEKKPPRPQLTRRQRVEQMIGRVLLAVALVLAALALGKALQAVNCINSALGDRGPATKQQSQATIDFIDQVVTVLVAPKGSQAAVYLQALPRIKADRVTLLQVQAARDSHPLGKC